MEKEGQRLPNQGVKREAALSGSRVRPAEVGAASRPLPPQPVGDCSPRGVIWDAFLWELGPTGNVKIVLCIIYLFIYAALTFLLMGSTLCRAVRLHKYLLWEAVGGVAQCEEYAARVEQRAKAV